MCAILMALKAVPVLPSSRRASRRIQKTTGQPLSLWSLGKRWSKFSWKPFLNISGKGRSKLGRVTDRLPRERGCGFSILGVTSNPGRTLSSLFSLTLPSRPGWTRQSPEVSSYLSVQWFCGVWWSRWRNRLLVAIPRTQKDLQSVNSIYSGLICSLQKWICWIISLKS